MLINMTTLYKIDTKGKVRIWQIETSGSSLIQHSGLEGGKLITNTKICKSKNIGKSNETTPEQQAISEMESEIKSKLDEGYFRTKEEALNTVVILPMLAKSYDDEKHKIDWSEDLVFVQPKLDGMRCLAFIEDGKVRLMSRDGKTITTVPHINKSLSEIKYGIILDGELYAHGKSFQENMSLIKKYREGESEEIMYHVYDIVSNDPFELRNRTLNLLIKSNKVCSFVETNEIFTEVSLKDFHAKNLAQGYEGSIVRWGNDPYKINGRSSNLLKYKDFQDIALTIVDIIPCEQRPNWGEPVFYWKGAKGHKYGDNHIGSGMKFSHKEREDFLLNKQNYIGNTAEIRFFEYSDTGVPRFPVMVGIRLDK